MICMSDVWLAIGDLSGAPIEAMARAHVIKESFSNNFGEMMMKVMMMVVVMKVMMMMMMMMLAQ